MTNWNGWRRFVNSCLQTSPNQGASRRTRVALFVEELESRLTPSTLTVNSLLEAVSPNTGSSQVTLRDAVLASENHSTDNLGQTGTGDDTIVFAPGLAAQDAGAGQGVIALSLGGDGLDGGSNANGPSALLITDTLTIMGPTGANGITITRDASESVLRLFETTAGGNLALQNLALTDGTALFVGSGNAGLGGGLFNAGTMTLTNCSLSGSSSDEAGGGVYTTGTLAIYASDCSANSATDGGGCIFAPQGTVTISGSTFSKNSTGGQGGALDGDGTATSATAPSPKTLAAPSRSTPGA
jgi:predicted outer membrane repeat protein